MSNITDNQAIIIFIKNPRLGKVKTRLAATIGDAGALAIYHQLCAYTREVTTPIVAEKIVFYSDFIDENDDWEAAFYAKKLQQGNDLGNRMSNAFEEVLMHFSSCIIIGSDCADLTEAIINEAFQLLKNQDVVIGAAADGGYYLLGMKKLYKSIFEGIEWSSEFVFENTIQRLEKLNLNYALLPTLSDIDTEQDWQKVAHRFQD